MVSSAADPLESQLEFEPKGKRATSAIIYDFHTKAYSVPAVSLTPRSRPESSKKDRKKKEEMQLPARVFSPRKRRMRVKSDDSTFALRSNSR